MAAMRKADTQNLGRLQLAFPEIWDEFKKRYNARLGVLPEEAAGIDYGILAEQIRTMGRPK